MSTAKPLKADKTDTAEKTTSIDFKNSEYYLNRQLSLLEFNWRVLQQARDESLPLLERLRFLCIFSTNMDEFFEIRVSGLQQKVEVGSLHTEADNTTPKQALLQISQRAHALVDEQYQLLDLILDQHLAAENVHFVRRNKWNSCMDSWLRNYFENELLPIISPLALDPSHPFPRILNKSLHFIVSLKGKDAFGRNSGLAIVQIPRALPRIIQLPFEECNCGPADFVFLSSVVHAYVESLFPGMSVKGCYQFRVTRNSDLYVDEEEIDDLLRAVEGELGSRRYGDAVRIEAAHDCPPEVCAYLLDKFKLTEQDLYQVEGPVNVNRLNEVYDLINRPELKYKPFTPSIPSKITLKSDIFETIRKQDVLLHHPYQSFAPVVDFIRQASTDPNVLAIKQTLYRTGPSSSVVNALVKAAKMGKEVTVVIELRARFDEEANISMATKLQEAGAHVVYGVVGFKTHAKMLLVIRRESQHLRQYAHLGTGNYHARTARLYTDYGFFTANKKICEDTNRVFHQLTSMGQTKNLNKLLQSPFTLQESLEAKIERERQYSLQGKATRIILKLNSLADADMIRALYRASTDGVKIDLIIRGMCCLRPGIAGVSENIQVRSIVGRFLEHDRVIYFKNDETPEVFISSADWMERNLYHRVEIATPIENRALQERIINELEYYLMDNTHAWIMNREGKYTQVSPENGKEAFSAQGKFLEDLAESS
ncbi:Polyphosphate kinase [hydrothermal vent metagenome]|uniref:ATP-polyphosphate phosphotransferase n=1 Tax=hydrothermal vent metagenome TaxID=652676 RepID=A0A3B0YFY6_9ZZZZ